MDKIQMAKQLEYLAGELSLVMLEIRKSADGNPNMVRRDDKIGEMVSNLYEMADDVTEEDKLLKELGE